MVFWKSGSELTVNSQTTGDQSNPNAVQLANGLLAVVWQSSNSAQDGSGSGIRLQLLNALGQPIGGEIRVNAAGTGDQMTPQVSSLAGGGFVVTWESGDPAQDGSGYAIKARVFAADGTALGGEFLVNTAATLDQRQPSVTYLADGGFVIAWQTTDTTQDGSGWAIKAQRFDAVGTKLGSEFLVNTSAFGSQNNVDLITLSDGRFVASWQYGNTAGSESFVRIYNADGTPAGAQIALGATGANSVGIFNTAATALTNGGFAVAFQNFDGIAYEFYNAAGQITVPRTFLPLLNGTGFTPEIATLADGRVVIQYVSGGSHYARVLSASGAADGPEFMTSSGKLAHALIGLSNGNFASLETSFGDGMDIGFQLFKVNTAPELGAPTKTFSNGENLTYAGGAFAQDDGGPSPLTYTIIGGADAAKFTISATSGVLNYIVAPNFEAPGDANGDNVYEVTVRVSDGELLDTQAIFITVTNQNEAPVIMSNGAGATAAFSVSEGSMIATTVVATDPESAVLTYAISGGTDAGLFTISAATGVLSFITGPNFEAPGDSNADNVYSVTVRVSDGTFADTQALTVTVANVNEGPTFSAPASFAIAENGSAAGTVSAIDPEGSALSYAVVGGADAALFTIDAASGALSFIAAPNYEAPADSNGDNVYDVVVSAGDGALSANQQVAVTVTNVNEAPTLVSPGSFAALENSPVAGNVAAIDPDGTALTYAIVGGVDAALFTIDMATGALSFVSAPDYEAPADGNGDNVYEVVVSASDGLLTDTQTIGVTVGNVNDAPVIAGGDTASASVAENGTSVSTVSASDVDGTVVTYAIVGGADAANFSIDAATGALSFVSAPDYEAPSDSNGDNVYQVTVSASDGSLTDIQAISVSVGNVNEAPSFTSSASQSALENATAAGSVAASDPDSNALTYTIVGGADAAKFTIDAQTGALSFISAPNYEEPGDADGDNAYEVTVRASDGSLTAIQAVTVSVGNVNDAPVITSQTIFSVGENGTAVGTIAASDAEGNAVTYSITGGADAAKFTINAQTGALSFIAAPNYEAPADSNGDNVYQITVSASDGSLTDSQTISVTVGNVNEAPVITSDGGGDTAAITIIENTSTVATLASSDPDSTARTYSISGGNDAAKFTINAATGALSFIAAPNYEAPTDSNGDNVYQVVVVASDGSLSDSQALSVTVGNVNEAPVISSNGGGDTASITINENSSAVTTLASSDPEGTARTYSIGGGTDAAKFTVNATTGALSFVSAPNFEVPTDSNGDNVYNVIVTVSDGSLTDSQTIAVTIANLIDGVILTGTTRGDTLTGGTAEDTISGLGGSDTLNGGAGADTINGGDGNDTLIGGAGADVLTGGAGADIFVYQALGDSSQAILDFITDFTSQDKISLSAIDAKVNLAGDQAFSWIGTGAFSNVAGQLRYYQQSGDTFVTGDVNGDGLGDFTIQIDPLVTLAATNFVL